MVTLETITGSVPTLLILLAEGLFVLTVLMHLERRNRALTTLYVLQSIVLALILLVFSIEDRDPSLLIVVALTLVVKVGLASRYFGRLLRSHHLSSSSGAYLPLPVTLLVIAGLTMFAHAERFQPLFGGQPSVAASLALCSILTAFFLTINRQGALSQIIGILTLENSIIAFATFLGLKQSLLVELGLAFDLAVWILVAAVFIRMVQQQFGSTTTTDMDQLKEE